jgi:hypothetical protein
MQSRTRKTAAGLIVFASLILLAGAANSGVWSIAISKHRIALQVDATGPRMVDPEPWRFDANIELQDAADIVGDPILEVPTGTSFWNAAMLARDLEWGVHTSFETRDALHEEFPSGTYTFVYVQEGHQSPTRTSLRIGGQYPGFVSLLRGEWEEGRLVYSLDAPLYIRWAVPNSEISGVIFRVWSHDGQEVVPKIFGEPDFTSYTIPQNMLPADGGYIHLSVNLLVDSTPKSMRGGAHLQSTTLIEIAPKSDR